MTNFALRLLTEAGGVWDQVESKDDVVSVLLPVHVRSPRRVKVLLNAFAQAFALALARAESGDLDKDVSKRASEVAKLVGLQIEFPLFAADLPIHRDLTELVLECAEADVAEELPALQGVIPGTQERVLKFAKGELPTDVALDGPGSISDDEMNAAQGTDLIEYLRQTAAVNGPKTDLVHLEGPSQPTGIDQALVIEIDDLALRNSPFLLKETLEGLDATELDRALNRLRELVRESKGNDATNAIRALLICWPLADSSAGIPSDLLAALARYQRDGGLQEDELPSALDVAIAGHDQSLQEAIVGRNEALSEPLRSSVLGHANTLIQGDPDRLGELMAEEIIRSPEKAAKRLTE